MSTDDKLFHDIVERELFVELMAYGTSAMNAGIEVGWSPRQTKRNLSDPEFKELVDAACDRANGTIEKALFDTAAKGNVSAVQMWLYNKKPDEWRDVKRIEIRQDTQITIGMVQSVKQGALELLREQGVQAIQALGPPAEDHEIVDAEIVE